MWAVGGDPKPGIYISARKRFDYSVARHTKSKIVSVNRVIYLKILPSEERESNPKKLSSGELLTNITVAPDTANFP